MQSDISQKLSNILLAYDGSEHSLAAVRLLCDLPLPKNTNVTAISILAPLLVYDHETLKQSLEQARSCLTKYDLNVTTEFISGYPAEKIIEYAENINPDLIVLGATGLRSTLGILLGGVAQQVVEYANWPVLIVRAPYKHTRRVLVAIDGSTYSLSALQFLVNFPLPGDSELHIIHVLPPLPEPLPALQTWPPAPEIVQPPLPVDVRRMEKVKAEQEQKGNSLLKQAEDMFRPTGISPVTEIRRGDAATEIIDYIKLNNIDLVVLGSRGLSQVRSWLLGSVSRKIIHYSNCTVLVVKHEHIP